MIALLRARLGTGPAVDAGALGACDWERFRRLASHHGLVPLLYKELRPHAARVPGDLLGGMRAATFANALRNQLAQRLFIDVAAALHEERIAVIALKGIALLRTLYPEDPSARCLSDVDVLVDEGEMRRAGARLESIGLERVETAADERRGPLCDIHAVYLEPGAVSVPLEVHWRLFEPYLPYRFDLAEVRADARRLPELPENVLAMSAEHELAHLCVHLERHAVFYRSLLGRRDWFELLMMPRGLGRLAWLYDIALYLRRRGEDIDWDRFVDCARRWTIEARVHAVLELCRRGLGAEAPAEVMRALERRPPRLSERLAHRVVVASYEAEEAQRIGALARLSGPVLRASNTWSSLFPPAAYLRGRYPGASSLLAARAHHLHQVIPGLYEEARGRWRARRTSRRGFET